MAEPTLSSIFSLLTTINSRIDDLDDRLRGHMHEEEEERRSLIDEVRSLRVLVEAFPHTEEGIPDIRGHRDYHDTMRGERKKTEEFWQRRKDKLADMIMTGIAVLLAAGFLNWVQHGGQVLQ